MAETFGGFCPAEVYFSDIGQMHCLLTGYPGGRPVALIADSALLGLLGQRGLPDLLRSRYELIWIDRVRPNPDQTDVIDALNRIGGKSPGRIVAVGGGSAIDLGKAVSAFHGLCLGGIPGVEDLTRMIREKAYRANPAPIPITAVPTTAGTGSELTRWATIWDVNKRAKFSIEGDMLYPGVAIIVPELTCSMPKKLILSTALDALCHAMEAFWARPSNPIIRDVATIAMMRIRQNLKKALEDPSDKGARAGLSRGSTLAGMAFSNTRTTACHSMSYPMTMLFQIDHGFACAMTLRQVAEINMPALPEIREMLDEVFGGIQAFCEWMDWVCAGVQPLRLSAFGLSSGDIPRLAAAAFTGGRMDNNPVALTPEQVREILESCI